MVFVLMDAVKKPYINLKMENGVVVLQQTNVME